MMILRSADASPFGRKVKMAAAILRLDGEIRVEAADPVNPADTLRQQNPLGKIPVLLLEDGTALYDFAGDRRISRQPRRRWRHHSDRTQGSLCGAASAGARRWPDGCRVDAGLRRAMARRRQARAEMDRAPGGQGVAHAWRPRIRSAAYEAVPNVGVIALAAALGYFDLRFGGRWRADYPRLVAWLDDFAARVPTFAKTKVAAEAAALNVPRAPGEDRGSRRRCRHTKECVPSNL